MAKDKNHRLRGANLNFASGHFRFWNDAAGSLFSSWTVLTYNPNQVNLLYPWFKYKLWFCISMHFFISIIDVLKVKSNSHKLHFAKIDIKNQDGGRSPLRMSWGRCWGSSGITSTSVLDFWYPCGWFQEDIRNVLFAGEFQPPLFMSSIAASVVNFSSWR